MAVKVTIQDSSSYNEFVTEFELSNITNRSLGSESKNFFAPEDKAEYCSCPKDLIYTVSESSVSRIPYDLVIQEQDIVSDSGKHQKKLKPKKWKSCEDSRVILKDSSSRVTIATSDFREFDRCANLESIRSGGDNTSFLSSMTRTSGATCLVNEEGDAKYRSNTDANGKPMGALCSKCTDLMQNLCLKEDIYMSCDNDVGPQRVVSSQATRKSYTSSSFLCNDSDVYYYGPQHASNHKLNDKQNHKSPFKSKSQGVLSADREENLIKVQVLGDSKSVRQDQGVMCDLVGAGGEDRWSRRTSENISGKASGDNESVRMIRSMESLLGKVDDYHSLLSVEMREDGIALQKGVPLNEDLSKDTVIKFQKRHYVIYNKNRTSAKSVWSVMRKICFLHFLAK